MTKRISVQESPSREHLDAAVVCDGLHRGLEQSFRRRSPLAHRVPPPAHHAGFPKGGGIEILRGNLIAVIIQ